MVKYLRFQFKRWSSKPISAVPLRLSVSLWPSVSKQSEGSSEQSIQALRLTLYVIREQPAITIVSG
jgi:hypothetical protein